MPVLFRLLGPLALGGGERVTGLSVPKVRCLLAVLLLDGDRTVTLDRLTDELWGDEPPRSAVANLRSYASTLRRALAAAGIDPERLVTAPGGYRLRVAPGECDVELWQSHATAGSTALAEGRHHEAVRRLGQALSCWRGAALADIPLGPSLAARASALDDLRTVHTEDLFEARLLVGDGAELLTPIREHIATRPTRERAYDQLMRVLYAAGDAAAALDVYQQARQALGDELGLEPGTRLQQTQAAILRRDPALVRTSPAPEVVPRQLPPDLTPLIGRDGELAALTASAASVRNIHGPGGVGKSALAIRLAHLLQDRYPDGQLYLDLQGSNPRLTPLTPADVLGRFLRALGVGDGDVPAEAAEATALYRTMLADRHMLVVLDNAVDAAQVRTLLPGTTNSLVLVTSRRALTSLDGGALFALDVLGEHDALRLLGRPDDAAAAQRLVAMCDRLPLALRIAAARLAARPDWSAQDLVDRLVDERHRLDELHTDDMAIRACFQASYHALDPAAARVFRLAGLARVPHLSVAAVAALLGDSRSAAASALDRLVDARMVEVDAGCYRLHDLLRLYAAECALAEDEPSWRAEALRRLLVYYLGTARRAVLHFAGVVRPIDPALTGPEGTDLVELPTTQDARRWLDAELVCAYTAAEQVGEATDTARSYPAQLLRATSNYALRRDTDGIVRLAEVALRLRTPDDLASEPIVHNLLGQARYYQRRYDESRVGLMRGLAAWQALGDLDGIAAAANGLGILNGRVGQFDEALRWYDMSREALEATGDVRLQSMVITNAAESLAGLRRFDEAVRSIRRSLRLIATSAATTHRMVAVGQLGVLYAQLGQVRPALHYCVRSIALSATLHDHGHWLDMTLCRGEMLLRARRPDLARADADAAMQRAIEINDLARRGSALRLLAKVQAALGDQAAAAHSRNAATGLIALHGRPHEQPIETFLAGDDPTLPHPP
ncbi:AfsR/SARP family transcriptional regulator [Catellatospora chokoriensis]|uniref:SARP family transcriptional regulator n=1 Tax=Catellatospora chokoriensis TaxID=310353 RepID=A0A8J3NT11_9ACTN|nr:BTAD domain-containing putative transcriptional regulator [Catellatospora chokoriensis]GIF91196.1 SARP family transcriptional regulator [Catellatospora chokoriensis]